MIMTDTEQLQEKLAEICSKLNIDETSKQLAIQNFTEVRKKTILEVSWDVSGLGVVTHLSGRVRLIRMTGLTSKSAQ